MRPSPLILLLCAPLSVALAAPRAGVLQPDADPAANVGASALESNPAGLAFGDGLELAYTFAQTEAYHPQQGHSLALSLGLMAPYFTGLGLHLLRDGPGERPGGQKWTWGHGLRLSKALTLGLSWSYLRGEGLGIDDAGWDLGAQYRPLRWIALGATAREIQSDAPGYELGVALRPGTERLTVAGFLSEDVHAQQRLGGLVSLDLFGGLALRARFERAMSGDDTLFIGLSDEIHGFGIYGYSPDVDAGVAGLGLTARLRSEAGPSPAALQRRPHIIELAIRDVAEVGTPPLLGGAPPTPFLDLLLTLRHLSEREDIDGVLLSFGDANPGWAQASEIRAQLLALKAAGKRVYAWLPVGDTRGYYIASAAHRVYSAPAGGVLLTGIKSEAYFIGDLLAKLGIHAEFIAAGAFKSFPEMFTRNSPSPDARRVEDALLDDLYARITAQIATARGKTPEAIRALIDAGPYTATQAKAAGIIDGVIHYDEFERVIREDQRAYPVFTDARQLARPRDRRWGAPPRIGLLYITGDIVDGEGGFGRSSTSALTLIGDARRMRDDPRVRAVVLRVDSPGGSVTAADAMWRELTLLAQAKPLYVSFGDVAASGGYYVAGPAREILASPESITGSIGIFTGKFDLTGLYAKLGVHHEVNGRGQQAKIMSEASAWSPAERARVQAAMDELYDLFIQRVAAGREGLDAAQIRPLAEGRVWTGAQAFACGLIDRPAGLLTALDLAVIAADLGIGDYELYLAPREADIGRLNPIPQFLGRLGRGHALSAAAIEALSGLLLHPSGRALARLPFSLTL
ncbi:signal peptide peptidase SppA [Myxococcota bacterium]|nr:signal peptide peptidase SppA [Myxococcota bacterium]MBU1896486.1 signal peptide peptidase SppA [Myxococcota bacterium]